MNQLRPFIARATFASTRLKLQQCRAALDILERIGLPAAALDALGRLRLGNSSLQNLVPKVAEDHRERLHLKARGADRLLAGALSNPASFGATFGLKSDEGIPFIVHMIPVAGAAQDIIAVCRWIVILVPVAKSEQVYAEVMRGLFDCRRKLEKSFFPQFRNVTIWRTRRSPFLLI